jgi:hypothetical protein
MSSDHFNAGATGLLALVTKLTKPFVMTVEKGAQTEIYKALFSALRRGSEMIKWLP